MACRSSQRFAPSFRIDGKQFAHLSHNRGCNRISAGIPFVSDADLNTTLEKAGVPPATAEAIVDANVSSRINGLRAALAVLALIAVGGPRPHAAGCPRRNRRAPNVGRGRGRGGRARPPRAQGRRRVTLHQARLRHEGQVIRRSNRPRGSQ